VAVQHALSTRHVTCTSTLSQYVPALPLLQTCADKLAAIKRDQSAIRSQQYAASSCPICLEDFDAPLTAAGAAAAARAAAVARSPAPAPPSPSEPAGSEDAGSSRSVSVARRAAAAPGGAAYDEELNGDGGASSSPSAPLLGGDAGAGGAAGSSSGVSMAEGAPGSGSKDRKGGKSERRGEGSGKKPLVLRCGHAFCDPCISK
jgi:hypothetical protein